MVNRILILTDEEVDAKILRDVLTRTADGPFVSECLTTLADGLARLTANDIDAILVDLSLPDSNGLATFDQLFAAVPHTPILTLSALEDDELAIEAVQRGSQGYLAKGYFGSNLVPQSLRSIIQRKAVEQSLFEEKARAEIALNSISDAVICTDLNGAISYLNIAAEKLTGWSREEANGQPIAKVFNIINGSTRDADQMPVDVVLRSDEPVALNANTVLIRHDGSEAAIEDSASPIHDWNGQLKGVVIVFHDITATQAMAMKMVHLAQHDFLTNLPNRVLLNDRIAQGITLAKRRHTQLALLFLDLDNFKHINDSLGHGIGDELLQSVSERLSACVRHSDTVSRQGGDEFVILLGEGTHETDAALIAEKIISVLAESHFINNSDLHVTTSIGISIYPNDGEDAETLIKNADTAMYHAKGKGRDNYQFFRRDMNVRAVERQFIEAHLRLALEKKEFLLHYQPKINLASGKITGIEALLRWKHPELGLLLPCKFISIAEDSGLIVPIGRWVLREACEQANRWLQSGLLFDSIAVNISALEFRNSGFFDSVHAILYQTGLDPARLELEITESVLMQDAKASSEILHKLKNMSVKLAMDDFGTGYSSLSYLQQFPIDVLKIDRSFVLDINSEKDNGIIVGAVITMGNSLKLQVIAEGVENVEQLEFLKAKQCDEVQGFLFSKPLIAEEMTALLTVGSPNYFNGFESVVLEGRI